MEEKLDLILTELQNLGKGQKELEEKLTAVEGRLTSVEERLTVVEGRLTVVEEQQTALESGQRELLQMVSAIRGNQLEARAGFERMQHDMAYMKGDIVEIKEALPTFATKSDLERVKIGSTCTRFKSPEYRNA